MRREWKVSGTKIIGDGSEWGEWVEETVSAFTAVQAACIAENKLSNERGEFMVMGVELIGPKPELSGPSPRE
jgi:hypothetical protein